MSWDTSPGHLPLLAGSFLTMPTLSLAQVNIPCRLPFSGVGKVKQAACAGTGCAVLNGENHFLTALWEAQGRSTGEGLVCVLQIQTVDSSGGGQCGHGPSHCISSVITEQVGLRLPAG